MPLRKVTSKAAKFSSAVYGGTKEYGAKMKDINRRAEKQVKKTGVRSVDVENTRKKMKEIKKREGVSWKGSIKKRLK